MNSHLFFMASLINIYCCRCGVVMSVRTALKRRYYERKVRTLFVTKEMFVVRLDRPWIDTPFWLQGFRVGTDEELRAINKYCNFVYIDINKGVEAEFYMEENLDLPTNEYLEELLDRKLKSTRRKVKYRMRSCLKDELIKARPILEETTIKYVLMMQAIKKGGELKLAEVYALIKPMLESVLRNADALILLIRLRNKKEYTFSHEIDACVLSILFGRKMGLAIEDLRVLAAGVLLFDIGKLKIDDAILNKSDNLTDEEFREVNMHVDYAIDILNKSENIPEDILNVALTHHERFDGSGYPNGVSGLNIPIYGRIAAIIDCYDAMTSQRPYSSPIEPAKALQQIHGWKESLFQSELVDEFTQCMGVYPNGSFVELSSGEVALVINQDEAHKLTPRVLIVLDARKQPYQTTKILDLSQENLSRSGKNMTIMKDISGADFGINTQIIYEKISSIIPEEALPGVSLSDRFSEKVDDVSGILGSFFELFNFRSKSDLHLKKNRA